MNSIYYAVAGLLSNFLVRGGGVKIWLTAHQNHPLTRFMLDHGLARLKNDEVSPRGLKVIHALFFGTAVWIHSSNPVFGGLEAVAMYAGQAPALFKSNVDAAQESVKVLLWAALVALRGLIWAAPIVAVAAFWSHWGALWQLIPAITMPLCYSFVWWLKNYTPYFNKWTASEGTFGADQWGMIAAM